MIITLHNLNVEARPKYDSTHIYIGRVSYPLHFGNRWSHGTHGPIPTYKVETRHDAVEAYRDWLTTDKYADREPERREWVLKRIREIAERDRDVDLLCFCHPEKCHGDVLKELIEAAAK